MSQPFSRSLALAAAIAAFMQVKKHDFGTAVQNLISDPKYKSRGKGGKGKARAHYSFISGDRRRYLNSVKSRKDTGLREARPHPVPTPNRVWVMDCSVFWDGSNMMQSKSRSALARLRFHKTMQRPIRLSLNGGQYV